MAPVLKRRTIDSTGSTSSRGMGVQSVRKSIRSRRERAGASSARAVYGLERLIAAAADGLLQGQDGLGVIAVDLGVGAAAELLEAAAVDGGVGGQLHGVEGGVVALGHGGGDVRKADAAHAADGVGEVAVDDILVDAHRLEDLGALIGLDGGDAHLGGNASPCRAEWPSHSRPRRRRSPCPAGPCR